MIARISDRTRLQSSLLNSIYRCLYNKVDTCSSIKIYTMTCSFRVWNVAFLFFCFLWMSWIWFTRSLPLNANDVTVGCILRSTNNKEKKQMLWKNKCFNFSVWSTLFTKLKCAITLARDTFSLHFDRVRNFNENVIKFINSSTCAHPVSKPLRLEREKRYSPSS